MGHQKFQFLVSCPQHVLGGRWDLSLLCVPRVAVANNGDISEIPCDVWSKDATKTATVTTSSFEAS